MIKVILISIILIFTGIITGVPTGCIDVLLVHTLPEYQEQNLDVSILKGTYVNNSFVLWNNKILDVNFTAYQDQPNYIIYPHKSGDSVIYVVRSERTNWNYQIYIKRELK